MKILMHGLGESRKSLRDMAFQLVPETDFERTFLTTWLDRKEISARIILHNDAGSILIDSEKLVEDGAGFKVVGAKT